jgi:hypothetical protein
LRGAWDQTEFQVNLKLGLTPRSRDPAEPALPNRRTTRGVGCGISQSAGPPTMPWDESGARVDAAVASKVWRKPPASGVA